MFGVCLTFYIIIIVINKEKIYSIFSDSTEIIYTPEFGLQFDTQGRIIP